MGLSTEGIEYACPPSVSERTETTDCINSKEGICHHLVILKNNPTRQRVLGLSSVLPKQGLVLYAYYLGCSKEEARRLMWVCGQPDIHTEFQYIQGYIMKHCLRTATATKIMWIHAHHFQANIKAFFQNFHVRSAQIHSLFFSKYMFFYTLFYIYPYTYLFFHETHLYTNRSRFKSTPSTNHLNSALNSYRLVPRWINFSRSFTVGHEWWKSLSLDHIYLKKRTMWMAIKFPDSHLLFQMTGQTMQWRVNSITSGSLRKSMNIKNKYICIS